MEEEPTDPHEQQLLAVFKSCLANEQSKLDKDGLLALCKKLELENHHRDAILELLKIDTTQKFISFYEFRDKFLQLLGKFQETPVDSSEKDVNGDSLIFFESKMNKKQAATMNSQEQQSDNVFVHQRWQETWSNQNSLLCEDVNTFCNRGAALPKQAIELIFEKLDIDCDGLINLEEFSHFFQSYNNNKLQEQSNINWSTHPVRDVTKSMCNKDFLHHQTGQLLRNVIVEQWEVAGVWEANSLLNTLGFDAPTINLIDLSNALSSELKLQRDVSTFEGAGQYIRLLKGALALYQEEVRNLISSLEHLSCERDKLRADIVEANDRANLLATDVDEQTTRMEKNCEEKIRQLEAKHAEAMKDLSNQLQSEREKSSSNLKSLEDQLHLSQQEEQRIRNELSTVLKELKQLEQENRSQNDEIVKLEGCNSQLSIQVQELATAQAQVESIETKENEQVSELMAHIKSLQEEMKTLRDQNDELTSELEMLKHRDNDAKSVVSSVDVRSTISDDNDGVVSMPMTEVSDTEDEDKQQSKPPDQSKVNKASDTMRNRINLDDNSSNGNSINKLTEIIQEFRNFLTSAKFCAECSVLRIEVSNLISELELYQSSVPMSAPLRAFNKKKKKHLTNLANELEAESRCYDRPTETYRDLVFTKPDRTKHYTRMSSSDDTIHDLLDDNIDDFCIKAMKNKLTGLRDYPPRKETENNNKNGANNNLDSKKLNFQRELLKSEESRHAIEKQLLIERCSDLEKSLELLRSEYEQCEDYWASKLDEERQLFEQEQKISDDKFTELIEKMAEYEEQFNTTKHDGRLSPIEEKSSLESQYNDLEEEFERWKLETHNEMEKKEKEVEELREKLESGKKLSLADISVQFPDVDDPPNKFPELYNHLCTPSVSAEGGSDKVDSAISPEAKYRTQPCHQCHKPVTQTNSNCHDKGHQQQQQQGQKKVHGKSEGKGNKRHHHHHQKRFDGDVEYKNLFKQKEKLKQEIVKLQGMKVLNANAMYPLMGIEEQNIFSNLYAKLYAQDNKIKYMQFVCQAQQKESQRAMHAMWKQHVTETNNLHYIIKSTENKLNQQIKMNKELNEKLIKGDLLTKELFVENGQHLETIKRLEQHCQILTESRIESTSA